MLYWVLSVKICVYLRMANGKWQMTNVITNFASSTATC